MNSNRASIRGQYEKRGPIWIKPGQIWHHGIITSGRLTPPFLVRIGFNELRSPGLKAAETPQKNLPFYKKRIFKT